MSRIPRLDCLDNNVTIATDDLFLIEKVGGDIEKRTAAEVASALSLYVVGDVALADVGTINLMNVANTPLYEVPSGKTLVVTKAIVICEDDDSVSVSSTIDIGGTSPTYDDIFTDIVSPGTVGLLAAGQYTSNASPFGTGVAIIQPAGTQIYARVSTAATGTSQTARIILFGILI